MQRAAPLPVGETRGSKLQEESAAPWNKWRGPARGEATVYAAKGRRIYLWRARAEPLEIKKRRFLVGQHIF